MKSPRKGEQSIFNKPRSDRGYEINGQWYFELRDGGQKGPYENKHAMQNDLNEFILLHKQMNQQN